MPTSTYRATNIKITRCFPIGCYTAQRFTDYSTICEGIRMLASRQQVIDQRQQKPENMPLSPYPPPNYRRSDERKVNKFIKEVAREAGIIEKIEISYIEKGEQKTRIVGKCVFVKTNTARRSGATNMYLAGIPSIAS